MGINNNIFDRRLNKVYQMKLLLPVSTTMALRPTLHRAFNPPSTIEDCSEFEISAEGHEQELVGDNLVDERAADRLYFGIQFLNPMGLKVPYYAEHSGDSRAMAWYIHKLSEYNTKSKVIRVEERQTELDLEHDMLLVSPSTFEFAEWQSISCFDLSPTLYHDFAFNVPEAQKDSSRFTSRWANNGKLISTTNSKTKFNVEVKTFLV